MGGLTFDALQRANKERAAYWTKGCDKKPDLAFAVIELGGEVGELQNKIKKLIRHQLGMPGGSDDMIEIVDELGDVVICCSLLANKLDVNLADAVAAKFNKTSAKHKFPVKLLPPLSSGGTWLQHARDDCARSVGKPFSAPPALADLAYADRYDATALNNQGDYILPGEQPKVS